MFISGYVNFFSEKVADNFLKKKLLSLLVPFFSWGLVNFVKSVYEYKTQWTDIWQFLANLLYHPDDNGLWFLWVLFLINLLIFIIKFLRISVERGLLISWILLNFLFLISTKFNVFGLALLKYHLFYYLSGLVFFRKKDMFMHSYKVVFYISIVIFPIFIAYWYRLHPPSILYERFARIPTKIIWLAYQYVCAFLGIFIVFGLVKILFRISGSLVIFLKRLGRITLEIYAVHFYLLALCYFLFDSLNGVTKILPTFITTTFFTLCVIMLMKKSSIISLLFFGQRQRKIV
jgi:fucose 4-O-acetylase-like acetyltransferase